MAFYGLPTEQHCEFNCNFRPELPIIHPSKRLFAISHGQLSLILIDRNLAEKSVHGKKILLKNHSHVALLFSDISREISKSIDYQILDVLDDFVNLWQPLLAWQCVTFSETERVVLFDNYHLVGPDKDCSAKFRGKNIGHGYATFILLTALLADKRNFPYRYLWGVIDPYSPDWKHHLAVYTSIGFADPQIVTENPLHQYLSHEMIQLTRNNDYVGQPIKNIGVVTNTNRLKVALVDSLKEKSICVAISWKKLGETLQHLKSGLHGTLVVTDRQRAIIPLKWPKFICSRSEINDCGLPFRTVVEPTDFSAIIRDHSPAILFVTLQGLTLVQPTNNLKKLLSYLWETPDQDKNLHILIENVQKSNKNVLQGLSLDVLDRFDGIGKNQLFLVAETSWDNLRNSQILYTHIFCNFEKLFYDSTIIQ